MGQRYVKYSREFRESALRRLALAPNVAQLCRELGVSRQLLYQWRDTEQREQQKSFRGPSSACARKTLSSKKRC